jgi:endonuclease/exonuclease/phosphatase family metal-dependent hydrolase
VRFMVACLNVNGTGGVDEFIGSGRAQAIAETIAAGDPDLVALQEFPFTEDPRPGSPIEVFSRVLGLPHHEEFGLLETCPPERVGLATFSRFEVVKDVRVEFPAPDQARAVADEGQHTPALHRKGTLVCAIQDPVELVLANVHGIPFHRFGIKADETIVGYWEEAGGLLNQTGFELPLLIAGDFNAEDRSGVGRGFGEDLEDLFAGRGTRHDGRQSDSMLVASLRALDSSVVAMSPIHTDHDLLTACVETKRD